MIQVHIVCHLPHKTAVNAWHSVLVNRANRLVPILENKLLVTSRFTKKVRAMHWGAMPEVRLLPY